MDDLFQTIKDMKEMTCTDETCSTIQKEVEMLDTEIKTVQMDLYTSIQGTCSKEICDKKSDKSYIDAVITNIYEIMDDLEGNTCSKETCHNIQVEAEILKKNTCREEKCIKIQREVDELEGNTCSKETCHNIQVEAENLTKNTCREEKCIKIQGEVDKLKMNTCSIEICSNIQKGIENIDICMENPWDMICKELFSSSNSMPETVTSILECFRYGLHSFVFSIPFEQILSL